MMASMTQLGLLCYLAIYLYNLLGVVVSFIDQLTGALPAEGLVLSRDILVCFLDCVWLPCASSKWFSKVSSGLRFGIMSHLRPLSLGCDKLGIRATSYPRESGSRV